MKTTKWTTRR